MRRLVRDGLTALGLAEVCTLVVVAPLVHPEHMGVYHWTGSAAGLFVPSLLDVGVVWGVLLLAVWAARGRVGFWVGVLAVAPWVAAVEWGLLWRVGTPWRELGVAYAGIAVGVGCSAAWQRSLSKAMRGAARLAATAMLFFGVGGMLLLGQLGWLGWGARGLNRVGAARQAPVGAARARIVWIVFDELSYRQVYERRFPGLRLPAFDALAAEGTVLTQVAPAGIFTDRVLPSLLSGVEVAGVRASAGGALSVRSGGGWREFDPHGTVFQDARDVGYGTAVTGWYLPYCRVLGAVLDRCFSSYEIGTKSGMSPGASVGRNMVGPLLEFAGAVGSGLRVSADRHIADYERLTAAAEAMLDDRSAGFVLLHLPVPHLGGIYRRGTGEMTSVGATYLDNLALADRCLGELRARLEKNGEWDATTVVVMGDHSWRTTGEWKARSAWSGEEDEASEGGRFDPRPAYVVKLAGQRGGARVDRPFAAIRTRALFDALFRGEIQTAGELSAWVGR